MTKKMKAVAPKREIRVLVCTPVYGDTVKRGYAHSLAQAVGYFAQCKADVDKYVDVTMVYSSSLIENRHMLVSRAFQFEATHMLFWDADIKVPADAIMRLLVHNLPIVAINYAKKNAEAQPTAYIDTEDYVGPCYSQEQHKGLQAVTSCGFGLMLIEIEVLQKLQTPLFQFTQVGQDGIKTEGEDQFFCAKARAAGYDIVIDHDLSKECAHLGDFEYTCAMSDIAQSAKQAIYRDMPTDGPDANV